MAIQDFDTTAIKPFRLKDLLAVLAPETVLEIADAKGTSACCAAYFNGGEERDRVVEYVAVSEKKGGHLRILLGRK